MTYVICNRCGAETPDNQRVVVQTSIDERRWLLCLPCRVVVARAVERAGGDSERTG